MYRSVVTIQTVILAERLNITVIAFSLPGARIPAPNPGWVDGALDPVIRCEQMQ